MATKSRRHGISGAVTSLIFMGILAFSAIHAAQAQTDCTGQAYCLLAPLPLSGGSAPDRTAEVGTYVQNLVRLIIALAGGLAVLQIIIAGFKYITVTTISGKDESKADIQNAFIGLGLALGSFLILNTINPKLVTNNILIQNNKDVGEAFKTNPADPGKSEPTGQTCGDSCVPMPDQSVVPSKTAAEGGCSGPGPCYVDSNLLIQLEALTAAMKDTGVGWQVSEMYPPKDPSHVSTCHQNGTCVDVALKDASELLNISVFMNAIKQAGFTSFQYEVPCPKPPANQDQNTCLDPTALRRRQTVENQVGPGFKVVNNVGAIGEHVHLNGPGAGPNG